MSVISADLRRSSHEAFLLKSDREAYGFYSEHFNFQEMDLVRFVSALQNMCKKET